MQLVKGKIFFLICVLYVLVSSCGTSKNISKGDYSIDTLPENKKIDFTYAFFEANKYDLDGSFELAVSLYKKCLDIYPYSSAVNYKLAGVYFKNDLLDKAEFHIEQSLKYDDENIWYNHLAAQIYVKSNNAEKAINQFKLLIDKNPKKMDYYLGLSDVYIDKKEYKEAIEIYDYIDDKFGKSELISLQKSKLYLFINKDEEAINEIYELYEYSGNDVDYKRLIADFYIQMEDIDNAIIIYNEILDEYKQDGFSLIGLAECYRLKNDLDRSIEYLKLAFNDENVDSDLKVNLILSLLQVSQNNPELKTTIYELVVISYTQFPNNIDIKTLYANYLIQTEKLDTARIIMHEIIEVRKDKYALWEQLVLLENNFKNWDTCYTVTVEALKYFPNQSFLYFFKGLSSFKLNEYEKALETLEFGYKITTKDDPLMADYISFLAEVNYKLGNKEKNI